MWKVKYAVTKNIDMNVLRPRVLNFRVDVCPVVEVESGQIGHFLK
jgi:hypothetical protein